MSDTRPATDDLRQAIEKALLTVAENVAKHTIQRSGWFDDDKCFRVDLRAAEEEILSVVQVRLAAAEAENARLRELVQEYVHWCASCDRNTPLPCKRCDTARRLLEAKP